MGWLAGGAGRPVLRWGGSLTEIERLGADEAPQRFGFVRRPDQLSAQP
jgi:hypothetical protein